MGNDITRSNILFPFTPDSEAHRSLVSGINDVFMVLPATGAVGSPLPLREYCGVLYAIEVLAASVIYLFKLSSPRGVLNIQFSVTKGLGVVRVDTDYIGIHAVLIVDSDDMYDTLGVHLIGDTPYAELEPSTMVWRTDTLTSLNFINAYRNWNPSDRDVDGLPWANVLSVSGGPLKFESGYNVSLQYNEDTQTLYVRGIPGAGEGTPDITPWDVEPPLDSSSSIKSINGLSGEVSIIGSDSVTINQSGSNALTVEVADE